MRSQERKLVYNRLASVCWQQVQSQNSFLENLRKKAEDIEYPENEIL